jgi:hypothetical protein
MEDMALESVLGMRKPAFPRGMLRPWTTCACEQGQRKLELSTHNTANNQEPNHNMNDFHKILRIRSNLAIDLKLAQKLERDVEIEDGAYADGAEEAHVQRLALLVNLGDVVVHGEDDGGPAEEQDEDAEED